MSEAPKAVFLSYASQDAGAARRICDALRAAGVEVWFDQSELRGGDAWDQKIRKQIRDCALFMPVVSANTQARREGYFRLEWKLAEDRTHLMAKGTPFLVPVCIDDTKDWDAIVPDSFMNVQWTRLPAGETSPQFVDRVGQLLSGGTTPPIRPRAVPVAAAGSPPAAPASPAAPAQSWRLWAIVAVAVLVGLAVASWRILRPARQAGPTEASAPARGNVVAASTAFPRDPDLRRAHLLVFGTENIPEDFALADDIVKPKLAAQPNDPETVIVAAEVAQEFVSRGFDTAQPRRALAQRLTERAVQLAPDNPDALAVLGRHLGNANTQFGRAEQLLRRAIALNPAEPRYYRTLYDTLFAAKSVAEADAFGREMAARFPNDPLVAYDIGRRFKDANDLANAEAWFDRSLAIHPLAFALVWKAWFALEAHGDPAAMKRALDQVPDRQRLNARVVFANYVHAVVTRDPAPAIEMLNGLADTWFTDFDFTGPKALLLGDLLQLEGHADLARIQYESALAEIQRMIARDPSDPRPRRPEFWGQFAVGHLDEARAALRVSAQAMPRPLRWNMRYSWWLGPIRGALLLGERSLALGLLREAAVEPSGRLLLRQLLQIDPAMAKFRQDPEIAALVAEPAAGVSAPAAEPSAPVAVSPARELAAKAKDLLLGLDATREDFALAEDLCQRALKLDSTDGEVWAVYSQLHAAYGYRGWDTSTERREQTRVAAERAMRLAPTSVEARLAQAGAWSNFGINRAETERILRQIVADDPTNKGALRFLAVTVLAAGKLDECLALNERAAALPGGDPLALFNNGRYLWQRDRPTEAYATLGRSLAQKPSFASALILKATMELSWKADLAAAEATLQQIPQPALLEDRANYVSGLLYYYQRRADRALAAWGSFPRESYSDFVFNGPKGLLLGLADELDHRDAAAKLEWRTALQVVEKKLAAAPNNSAQLTHKAYLLACLGDKPAAEEALRTSEELAGLRADRTTAMTFNEAVVYVRLGRIDDFFRRPPVADLDRVRVDPRFDAVRSDARYGPLVAARRSAEPTNRP